MIIGETLFANSEGTTYYTPWLPRGGDNADFSAQVIASADCNVTVSVETKNSEMPDGSSDVVTTTGKALTMTANATTSWKPTTTSSPSGTFAGCLELVRFKIEATSTNGGIGFVHLRVLAPSWVTN